MTPLEAARILADDPPKDHGDDDIAYCQYCGMPFGGHADDCAVLALPKIVRVLEWLNVAIDEMGENPIRDEHGLQGLCSRTEECIGCGVRSFTGNHADACDWEEIVTLMKGGM